MNDDSISRKDVVNLIWNNDRRFLINEKATEELADLVCAIPAKSGRWTLNPLTSHIECSVCKSNEIINDCGEEVYSNFCPWCGASMELSEPYRGSDHE